MPVTRESSFLCNYESPSRHVTLGVLAWDAREALESFKELLERDGKLGRGRIRITSPAAKPGPRATARGRTSVTVS